MSSPTWPPVSYPTAEFHNPQWGINAGAVGPWVAPTAEGHRYCDYTLPVPANPVTDLLMVNGCGWYCPGAKLSSGNAGGFLQFSGGGTNVRFTNYTWTTGGLTTDWGYFAFQLLRGFSKVQSAVASFDLVPSSPGDEARHVERDITIPTDLTSIEKTMLTVPAVGPVREGAAEGNAPIQGFNAYLVDVATIRFTFEQAGGSSGAFYLPWFVGEVT